jgi:hypothetical protein
MSKTRPPAAAKAPRRARRPSRSRRERRSGAERTVDVISQLECATRHPRAAILGGLLGGAVPWFARALAHGEIPEAWSGGHTVLAAVMLAVVLGCAAFSMLTVYKFGKAAFGDERKAVGFVLALEGVMLVAHGTTSVVALLLLVVINAIANGCVIALSREATARRQEADARRSATRAQNRARGRGETAPAAPAPSTSAPVAPATSRTPAPRTRRPSAVPGLAHRPRWMPEAVDDAEIVSEERYAFS